MSYEDDVKHCKDCCCARSWKALGIGEYTGKSIPEHVSDLYRIAELSSKIDVVWEDDEAHDPGEWDELLAELRQALRPWRAARAGSAALAAASPSSDGAVKP